MTFPPVPQPTILKADRYVKGRKSEQGEHERAFEEMEIDLEEIAVPGTIDLSELPVRIE